MSYHDPTTEQAVYAAPDPTALFPVAPPQADDEQYLDDDDGSGSVRRPRASGSGR